MTSQLPPWFTSSIGDLASYPENLVHKSTYPGALTSYRGRLDEIGTKLFVVKEDYVNVPFRDLIGDGPGYSISSGLDWWKVSKLHQGSINTKYTLMRSSKYASVKHQGCIPILRQFGRIGDVVLCEFLCFIVEKEQGINAE